jgi:hypothetical protein
MRNGTYLVTLGTKCPIFDERKWERYSKDIWIVETVNFVQISNAFAGKKQKE